MKALITVALGILKRGMDYFLPAENRQMAKKRKRAKQLAVEYVEALRANNHVLADSLLVELKRLRKDP